ncbi:MAG: phosphoenolpyruvate--protein phosphotransferase [Candidatus Kapabacteria bacterium]|nr:phosphoenolpyruvate--protein phosphotransferase [Candidatus Kapabacteria bacterium]
MESDPGGSAYRLLPFQLRLQGSAASRGIAIGKAVVLSAPHVRLLHWRSIAPAERDHEIKRYQDAQRQLLESIRASLASAPTIGDTHAIIESYEMIATDPLIVDSIIARIATEGMPAEVAVSTAYDAHIHALAESNDPFLRERRFELENLRRKLVALLLSSDKSALPEVRNAIIVAPSLLASDVLHYHSRGVQGFITEIGGITSHACIVARTLGLPAVIGVRSATTIIPDGAEVIVDGSRGIVIVEPDAPTRVHYTTLQQEQQIAPPTISQPVTTADGLPIAVYASVDTPDDIPVALSHGADGIGLVRTEMLLVRVQHFPSEQEQFLWYSAIAERAYPKVVTLRVFDVGSDKIIHGMPDEANPALGLRGLRFLLHRKDLFRTQLRAILRASVHRNVRILLPMVTSVDELTATRDLIEAVKAELNAEQIPYDEHVPVGIMIETPAAALLAEHFAENVRFFSIGTNDLTQYTLAADRTSDLVAHIFDQLNPAVLRLLQYAASAARSRGVELELCGDLATFLMATDLLIGIGIGAFSVAPSYIPALKERIRTIRYNHALSLVEQALQKSHSAEVHALLEQHSQRSSHQSQKL